MIDYTFIGDNSLNLTRQANDADEPYNNGIRLSDEKGKDEHTHLRRAKTAKLDNKLKYESKLTGGQNMQEHSSVYE
jgi:hypothetical protein